MTGGGQPQGVPIVIIRLCGSASRLSARGSSLCHQPFILAPVTCRQGSTAPHHAISDRHSHHLLVHNRRRVNSAVESLAVRSPVGHGDFRTAGADCAGDTFRSRTRRCDAGRRRRAHSGCERRVAERRRQHRSRSDRERLGRSGDLSRRAGRPLRRTGFP